MALHYLIGDATDPLVKPALICHICNDVGAWGAGFVIALSKKNRNPEKLYRKWYHEEKDSFVLGAIQITSFDENVWVANMIAQKDIRWEGQEPPIRYDALETCLKSVYRHAENRGLTVSMPRIGADLAGGDWPTIEAIIKKTMTVETYVYTLEAQKDRWPTQYKDADKIKKVIDIINDVELIPPPEDLPLITDENIGDFFK